MRATRRNVLSRRSAASMTGTALSAGEHGAVTLGLRRVRCTLYNVQPGLVSWCPHGNGPHVSDPFYGLATPQPCIGQAGPGGTLPRMNVPTDAIRIDGGVSTTDRTGLAGPFQLLPRPFGARDHFPFGLLAYFQTCQYLPAPASTCPRLPIPVSTCQQLQIPASTSQYQRVVSSPQ